MTTETVRVEEHTVTGADLLAKAKEIVHEGNVRRIIIKNHDGVTLMEVPLTIGLVGAVVQPLWVALGAIAALAAHYKIAVERPAERGRQWEAEPVTFHGREI